MVDPCRSDKTDHRMLRPALYRKGVCAILQWTHCNNCCYRANSTLVWSRFAPCGAERKQTEINPRLPEPTVHALLLRFPVLSTSSGRHNKHHSPRIPTSTRGMPPSACISATGVTLDKQEKILAALGRRNMKRFLLKTKTTLTYTVVPCNLGCGGLN